MTEKEKLDFLFSKGWYFYYSKTHLVHRDIFSFLEKLKIMYFRSDHTNYQYTIDRAYEIYLKCQQHD